MKMDTDGMTDAEVIAAALIEVVDALAQITKALRAVADAVKELAESQ